MTVVGGRVRGPADRAGAFGAVARSARMVPGVLFGFGVVLRVTCSYA